MKEIEYNFITKNQDHSIVLFVKVEPEWLDKDLGIEINNNKLEVFLDEKKYETKELNSLVIEYYEKNDLPIVFCDNEGNFLAEMDLFKKNNKKMKI